MPYLCRMNKIFLQGLLWLFIFSTGFFVASLEPGYLDFDNLPDTNFSCVGKVIGGYYADLETNCQMFHVCTIGQLDEPMDIRFLCLNGTVFDQETRVCERIDEVDCSKSEKFYSLNLELYGNTQPPILEENIETESPIVEKSPPSTTTTTTTARPKTTTTKRPLQYFSSSIRPITPSPYHKGPSSHQFSLDQRSPEYTPEEINISLNPGAPPNIRTKPFEYPRHPYSDNVNKKVVTTHSSVFKSDNDNEKKQSVQNRIQLSSTTTESDTKYKNIQTPRPPPNFNYNFDYDEDESDDFSSPRPHNYHYQSNIANFRPPGLSGHSYSNNPYRSSTHRNEYLPVTRKNFEENHPTSTTRSFYLQPIKSPSHQYFTRAERPQGEQLPLPVLPTLSPIVFSSPAPFTLSRHLGSKRFTDNHELPPRIIISASASVSDASGRTLNYSLGTIGAAKILAQPPSSYDDYKEDDVVLDPFFHDVPKVSKAKRSKREITRKSRSKRELNPSDIIKSEDEAIEVLKFLFDWYKQQERTTKATTISIPVSPDVITSINEEFSQRPSTSDDYFDEEDKKQKEHGLNNVENMFTNSKPPQGQTSWNTPTESFKNIGAQGTRFKESLEHETGVAGNNVQNYGRTRTTNSRQRPHRGRHRFTVPFAATENPRYDYDHEPHYRRSQNIPHTHGRGRHRISPPVEDHEEDVQKTEESHKSHKYFDERVSYGTVGRQFNDVPLSNFETTTGRKNNGHVEKQLNFKVDVEFKNETPQAIPQETTVDVTESSIQTTQSQMIKETQETAATVSQTVTIPVDSTENTIATELTERSPQRTTISDETSQNLTATAQTKNIETEQPTTTENLGETLGYTYVSNLPTTSENSRQTLDYTYVTNQPATLENSRQTLDYTYVSNQPTTFENSRQTNVSNVTREESIKTTIEYQQTTPKSDTFDVYDYVNDNYEPETYSEKQQVENAEKHLAKGVVHEETNIDYTEKPDYERKNTINSESIVETTTDDLGTSVGSTPRFKYIDKNLNSFSEILKSLRDFQNYEQNIYDYNNNLTAIKEYNSTTNEKEDITTSLPTTWESNDEKNYRETTKLNEETTTKLYTNEHREELNERKSTDSTSYADIQTESIENTLISTEEEKLYTSNLLNNVEYDTYTTISPNNLGETEFVPFGTEYTETTSTGVLQTTTSIPKEEKETTTPAKITTPQLLETTVEFTEAAIVDQVTPRSRIRGRGRSHYKKPEENQVKASRRRNSRRKQKPKIEETVNKDETINNSELIAKQEANDTASSPIEIKTTPSGFFITKSPVTIDSSSLTSNQTTDSLVSFEKQTTLNEEAAKSTQDEATTNPIPSTLIFIIKTTEKPGIDYTNNNQEYTSTIETTPTTIIDELFNDTETVTEPITTLGTELKTDEKINTSQEVTTPITNNLIENYFTQFRTTTENEIIVKRRKNSTLRRFQTTPIDFTTTTEIPTTPAYLNNLIKEIENATNSVAYTEAVEEMMSTKEATGTTEQPQDIDNIIKEIEETTKSISVTKIKEEITETIATKLEELTTIPTTNDLTTQKVETTTQIPTTKIEVNTQINVSEVDGPLKHIKTHKSHSVNVVGERTTEDSSNRDARYNRRRTQQKLTKKKTAGFRRFSSRHRFSTSVTPKDDSSLPTSTEAKIRENIASTDPTLAKNVKPTQGEAKKSDLSTTPLSMLYKVQLRKEKVNKQFIFNCFGKPLNTFYSDPRDCRLFHYCTRGYTKNQLLDMKFVCDLGTHFDDKKLVCTKEIPERCS